MSAGAIVALDMGGKRIGVARCDPTRTLVTPVTVFTRTGRDGDQARLAELLDGQEAGTIVVGLPLNMDGSEGGQAKTARADAAAFLEGRRERIIFCDERLTTFEADRRQGGPQKGDDARAAAVLLEDYVRARKEDDCE